jgi:hypothetical protein
MNFIAIKMMELEKAVKIGMDELTKITTLRINGKITPFDPNHPLNKCSPCTLPKLEDKKQPPEFWYIDIVEEKDSELLPKFKKWYLKKINTRIDFIYSKYGFSGWRSFNGYDWISIRGWEANSDKMQKITLNQWNNWFNK